MGDSPSIGVRIEQALVSYSNYRALYLYFTPENHIDFEAMRALRSGQKGPWAEEQLAKADKRVEHLIASPQHPLRGFGVGLLPEYDGRILLVAKKEKDNTKITATSGYTSSKQELNHPLVGAVREFAEEICFSKDGMLCLPVHSGVRNIDASVSEKSLDEICKDALLSRMPVYGIENAEVDRVQVQCTTKNVLSDYLGLDRIIFFNTKTRSQREFNGWFYWDPSTAGVNILFYAKIETDATPFSGELVYGEQCLDESLRVVALTPQELLSLGEPRTMEAKVYDGKTRILNTLPGGMNRAIARWHK